MRYIFRREPSKIRFQRALRHGVLDVLQNSSMLVRFNVYLVQP